MLNDIKDDYITFPMTTEENMETIDTFKESTLLPNVFANIDVTHIAIAPEENAADYFSRYQQYDISCQGVTDGKRRFLYVSAGYPGSIHDSRIYRNSNIKLISPYILGDSAYPISRMLMKPYSHLTSDRKEKFFNYQLSKARVRVEQAFGVLKGRFRILQKRMDYSSEAAAKIFIACAVIHNFSI